jgi:biopolymer transport protein ExbD
MIVGDLELPDHYKRTLLTQRPSRKRAAKKRTDPYRRINAAPLASVMLAILYLFLPAETEVLKYMPVDLTRSRQAIPMPSAIRDDAMRVAISMSGDIYFGAHKIDPYDLREQIRAGLRNGAERRVYLSVDARAKYSNVTTVLREVRLAGIEDVSFLTN